MISVLIATFFWKSDGGGGYKIRFRFSSLKPGMRHPYLSENGAAVPAMVRALQ